MDRLRGQIAALLQREKRFVAQDGGLRLHDVYRAAMELDPALLRLLLGDPAARRHFFTEVGDVWVFDKQAFLQLLEDCPGPADGVALDFPHKRCVLAGGQTKADRRQDAVFYHETWEADKVARLLSPKVLVGARRYVPEGETPADDWQERDNLLIKGDNLMALVSLRRRYAGRVQMVYADIPYNTGSDSFGYNDRFPRSTWLTFIKNRVDLLRQLLAEQGVLLMQCSVHQYAYLKVLLDELMGENCHKVTFHLLVRHPERILTGDKEFNDVMEYLLVYSRSPRFRMPKQPRVKEAGEYVYQVVPVAEGTRLTLGGKRVVRYLPGEYRLERGEPAADGLKPISIRGSIREKNSSGRFYVRYLQPLEGDDPPETLFLVEGIGDDGRSCRAFQLPKDGNKNGRYFQGKPQSSQVTWRPYPNFLDLQADYNMVAKEGGVDFRNGKKPERLLKRLLELFTQPGDLVLDPFLGSGTTCAVAHKMGRQYIGVEQMDYMEEVTLGRMAAVVAGEQGGISQEVGWQGGGSFVYCELAKGSQPFAARIQSAEDEAALAAIREELLAGGIFSPLTEDACSPLSEQKAALLDRLDREAPCCSLRDLVEGRCPVSSEDQRFNRCFYSIEEGASDGRNE